MFDRNTLTFVLTFSILAVGSMASAKGLSAYRPPNVDAFRILDFHQTRSRLEKIQQDQAAAPAAQTAPFPSSAARSESQLEVIPPFVTQPAPIIQTVMSARSDMTEGKPKWDRIPETAQDVMLRDFEEMKNSKMLTDDENRPRRLTWHYPDDGCFARAEMGVNQLEKKKTVVPAKIFAFGNLVATTPNHPSGSVTWWYHVAPIVRVGKDNYVMDPALDSSGPLLLKNWLAHMGDGKIQISICQSHVYDPESDCDAKTPGDQKKALSDSNYYLPLEWERVEQLGQDPTKELLKKISIPEVNVP